MMARAVLRACPPGGPQNQSGFLRTLLHDALLAKDAIYKQEWTALTNGGAPHV